MLVKIKNLLRYKALALLAVVFLIGAGAYALDTFGYLDFARRDTVTVVGTSRNTVKNQIATFTASVSASDPQKSVAVSSMNRMAKDLIDSVKSFGIAPADIKTLNMNVYQEQIWNQEEQKSEYKDWRASMDVEVKLRDVDKATDLSGLLSQLDVSNLYGPMLTTDESKQNDAAMLQQALLDAQTKAEALASASGRRLGKVTKVVEGSVDEANPIFFERFGMGGGGAAPIEPGSSTVVKTVTVTFKLR